MIKSPISYTGNKSQLADELFAYYPTECRNYIEPFVGSGGMLLHVLQRKEMTIKGHVYAYDLNKHVINLYKCIQRTPNDLYEAIKTLTDAFGNIEDVEHARSFYNKKRLNMNLGVYDDVSTAAAFWFLNKTGYGSMYRENKEGFYNVSFNKSRMNSEVYPISRNKLLLISKLVRDVTFECIDYMDAIKCRHDDLSKKDFVFLDPPYEKSSLKYVRGIMFDHEKFKRVALPSLLEKTRLVVTNSETTDYSDTGLKKQCLVVKRTLSNKDNTGKTVRKTRTESVFYL